MKKDLGSKRVKPGGLCRRAHATSSPGQPAGRASPLDGELHEGRRGDHSTHNILSKGSSNGGLNSPAPQAPLPLPPPFYK